MQQTDFRGAATETAKQAAATAAAAAAAALWARYAPDRPGATAADAAAGLNRWASAPRPPVPANLVPQQAQLPPPPAAHVGPLKAPTQTTGWAELVAKVHREELLQVLRQFRVDVDGKTSEADLRLMATALITEDHTTLPDGATPLCKVSNTSYCPLKRFVVADAKDFVHVNTPQGHSLQTEGLRQQRKAADLQLAPPILVFHPHATNAVQVVTLNLAWPKLGFLTIAELQASGRNALKAYELAQQGLNRLHQAGITHNNMTLENIYVRPGDGAVRFEGWEKAAAVSTDPAQAMNQIQQDQLPPLTVFA